MFSFWPSPRWRLRQRLEMSLQLLQVVVDIVARVADVGELVRLHERHLNRAGGVGASSGKTQDEQRR